ncbi:LL-diaminopimelate aminotransferase [Spirochaeta dissipatitropha]
MIKINSHYRKLQSSYLFVEIAKRVKSFQETNPDKNIIKLGIGDVTRALSPSIIKAFQEAVNEMGQDSSFRGYGPEQGYAFLREAIAEHDYLSRGAHISADEIFISDGAKCDTGNILEILDQDIRIAVPDPVYPVYVDSTVMSGRTGAIDNKRYSGLTYLEGNLENGYVPMPGTDLKADVIFLCFPNNPTGAVASREQLTAWVEYAHQNGALILFDAAYEAFIQNPDIPHSIYEIPGARDVAIEFRSFSKTAGFTGTRCAFTVVPSSLQGQDSEGNQISLWELWNRRQSTKFNGVSYPVQKAAAAIYSEQGKKETTEQIKYYLENAAIIRETMEAAGYTVTGGTDSPYIWISVAGDSWDFFDKLLNEAAVVCTPGTGFGRAGEGCIRISAFNHRDKVIEAMERIRPILSR